MRFFCFLLLLLSAPLWGACTTDSHGVCLSGMGTPFDRILGPQVPLASSPWPYYTIVTPLVVDSIYSAATGAGKEPSLGTALTGSGTCTYTDAPSGLTCTGSLFLTEAPPPTRLIVAWNSVDGAGTGRFFDTVGAVTDNTHLTFSTFQTLVPPATNLSVYRVPADTGTYQAAWWMQYPGNYSNGWNYYGFCDALYGYAVQTGVAGDMTKARNWANIWWQWSADHGRTLVHVPRAGDAECVFLRALDGHPEAFANTYASMQFFSNRPDYDPGNHDHLVVQDARERAYYTSALAMGAIADTNANGGSDTRHVWYCSTLATHIAGWVASQEVEGFIDEPVFQWAAFPYSGKHNSPWRSNIIAKAWQQAYVVLNDTSSAGCNNQSLAASLLTSIKKLVDWMYGYGVSKVALGGNGYGHYDVGSPSRGLLGLGVANGSGTIAISLSSTTVVGTGTNFTGQTGCNSTKYIAFTDPLVYHYTSVYKVSGCADTTHATITPAFGTYGEPSSVTVATYLVADQSTSNCASLATYCDTTDQTPPKGDPNSIRDYAGALGWTWVYSGDVKYKAWGDEIFARTYRGPADGPYGTMAPSGPGGLAYGGSTTDETGTACGLGFTCKDALANALPTPCGNGCGSGPYVALGKDFGQAQGFLCSQCYLAYRLMDAVVPPPTGSILIVTGANKLTGTVKVP